MNLLFLTFSLLLLVSLTKAQTATVISENANLRGTPNQSGKVVSTLSIGSTVEVIKQNGSWFLVQSDEYAGWMHGNTIRYQMAVVPNDYYPAPAKIKSTPSTKRSSESRYYIRGPRGGCYYINGNGNKTYVNRSLCN